jgi:DNA-binding transcriptional MerR regulator
MAIQNRLYGAKEVTDILGVKPEEVFLWSRTWSLFEPAERAKGPRGRNKYDFINLLDMALIRELLLFGFNLRSIKKIFESPLTFEQLGLMTVYGEQARDLPTIWEEINKARLSYEIDGAVLLVDKGSSMDTVSATSIHVDIITKDRDQVTAYMLTLKSAINHFSSFYLGSGHGAHGFATLLMVDLLAIVHIIEMATGQKLQGERLE